MGNITLAKSESLSEPEYSPDDFQSKDKFLNKVIENLDRKIEIAEKEYERYKSVSMHHIQFKKEYYQK